jgi:hypothetical protein
LERPVGGRQARAPPDFRKAARLEQQESDNQRAERDLMNAGQDVRAEF